MNFIPNALPIRLRLYAEGIRYPYPLTTPGIPPDKRMLETLMGSERPNLDPRFR